MMSIIKIKLGRSHSRMPSGPLDCGCCDWRDAREFLRETAAAREAAFEIASPAEAMVEKLEGQA